MSTTLESYVERFANTTIVVIGDLILDEYITGRATRMSREAPVPVLELESKRYIAGGAANPAANIVSLGGRAKQVGMIGEDRAGERLKQILIDQGIDAEGLIQHKAHPTTVKTRILAQMGLRFPQQLTRIDSLTREPIDPETESLIVGFARRVLDETDAVLLSHYDGGLLTSPLVARLRDLCAAGGKLLAADAQGNFETFSGLDIIKCNAEDAGRYLNRGLVSDSDFSEAALQLHEALGAVRATIITRGNQGATLAAQDRVHHCPAPQVSDVFDTVGAGDTAIATLVLALVAGAAAKEAVTLANHASGIVVRHFGNYSPSPAELMRSLGGDL
ncbi:MAG: PfkB family carbohydrate kinase [Chloroflexi bacterium]|nr:PfkB family carbohydrate kinase [Chloroflexota bacterium]